MKDLRIFPDRLSGASDIIVSSEADNTWFCRMIAHAFSEKTLRGREALMKGYIDIFISRSKTKESSAEIVNMVKCFNF